MKTMHEQYIQRRLLVSLSVAVAKFPAAFNGPGLVITGD